MAEATNAASEATVDYYTTQGRAVNTGDRQQMQGQLKRQMGITDNLYREQEAYAKELLKAAEIFGENSNQFLEAQTQYQEIVKALTESKNATLTLSHEIEELRFTVRGFIVERIESFVNKLSGIASLAEKRGTNPALGYKVTEDLYAEQLKYNNDLILKYDEDIKDRKVQISERVAAYEAIADRLEALEKGGNVNLLNRPTISSKELKNAGWDVDPYSVATVYSSTFTDAKETKAVNFTPIIVDGDGNYIGVLSPNELQRYAEDVIAGTRKDNLNLQIGSEFTGKNAIADAEEAAIAIHNLHEQMDDTDALQINSEEYQKLYNNIVSDEEALLKLYSANEDLKMSIRNLRWQPFKEFQENLDKIESDFNHIQSFIRDGELLDDDGQFTARGFAQIALIGENMDAAEKKIANARAAIEKLNDELEVGTINEETFGEEFEQQMKIIQDSASEAYDAMQKLADMYIKQITEENSILQDLIKKRQEALSKKKA